jgi:hypothetical protein
MCEGIDDSNEDGVGVNEYFNYDNAFPPTQLPLSAPPAHPNCRCAMGLTDDEGDAMQAEETDESDEE